MNEYHYKSQIIASSIRNPMHIINCAKMGVNSDIIGFYFRAVETSFNRFRPRKILKDARLLISELSIN